MRFRVFVACAAFAAVIAASVAAGASMPKGGTIRFFVTPAPSGDGVTIVVAGAIGDYGKTTPIKKGFGKAILKKGTFEVNLTSIQKKLNSASPTIANTTTCSFVFGATAPVTIASGTGLYKGIKGVGTITETFAGIGPLYKSGAKKGQCNQSNNANPIAQWGSVTGTMAVTFS